MPERIMHRDGTKFCRACGQWLTLDLFHGDKRRWDGLAFYCRLCSAAERRAYRARVRTSPTAHAQFLATKRAQYARRHPTPSDRSKQHRRYKYGLTPADHARLLADQAGVCAICRMPGRTARGLDVDHDHLTGRVRGLLCHPCNLGLGAFKDSPEMLQTALAYLMG